MAEKMVFEVRGRLAWQQLKLLRRNETEIYFEFLQLLPNIGKRFRLALIYLVHHSRIRFIAARRTEHCAKDKCNTGLMVSVDLFNVAQDTVCLLTLDPPVADPFEFKLRDGLVTGFPQRKDLREIFVDSDVSIVIVLACGDDMFRLERTRVRIETNVPLHATNSATSEFSSRIPPVSQRPRMPP